jgi:hypothetical protein
MDDLIAGQIGALELGGKTEHASQLDTRWVVPDLRPPDKPRAPLRRGRANPH